jgi:hypothetical protein
LVEEMHGGDVDLEYGSPFVLGVFRQRDARRAQEASGVHGDVETGTAVFDCGGNGSTTRRCDEVGSDWND